MAPSTDWAGHHDRSVILGQTPRRIPTRLAICCELRQRGFSHISSVASIISPPEFELDHLAKEINVNTFELRNRFPALFMLLGLCMLTATAVQGCGIFGLGAESDPDSAAKSASTPSNMNSASYDLEDAVWGGRTQAVQTLLDEGADVNAKDVEGNPILREAVWRGHAEIVRLLVESGADVNAKDAEGNPILREAVWRGHAEIVRLLVESGADVNAKDTEGNPILREAVWRGHAEIVRLLVESGADVNAKDTEGNPILREAVWRGHAEIVRLLVESGADVNAKDAEGNPMLHEATWRGHTDIEAILREAGAAEEP